MHSVYNLEELERCRLAMCVCANMGWSK